MLIAHITVGYFLYNIDKNMEKTKMQTVNISVAKLKSNTGQIPGVPKNPRFIKDERFKKLVESIKEDPEMLQLREVIAYQYNDDLIVIAGNMRLRACKEAGIKEVPTKILPMDTPVEKLRAYIVKDNVPFGENDIDLLANEWDPMELETWGLELPDLNIVEEETTEDESPEVDDKEPPKSEPGTVYQLGRHRLMCGDAIKEYDINVLLNGQLADMVFTDPPYNTGMTGKSQGSDTLWRGNGKNKGGGRLTHMFDDSYSDDEWEEFMAGFCSSYFRATKDDVAVYICLDWRRNHELVPHIKDHFKLSNIIVWDKVVHGLGSDYKYTYELINVCKKGSPKLDTHQGDREYSDVWHIQRKMGRDEDHATKKPLEIPARAIRHASQKGDIVLDLFGGSGSTLIAAEQTSRKCYMMELDPKYVDVIRKRYWKFVNGSEEGWEEATPPVE